MEFLIGAASGVTAVTFSNPFEVVKTRMQLQGELKKRGDYAVHYKGPFQASYVIAKTDGLLALQKGLAAAMMYQCVMSSLRLGIFQTAENYGLTRTEQGKLSLWRSTIVGAFSGGVGCFVASPFNLVKTQMQANSNIAVGQQYPHKNSIQALITIARKEGIAGLYRGSRMAALRIAVGGSLQITSYTKSKEILGSNSVFQNYPSIIIPVSSVISGAFVAVGASPLDVILTRLYNQPLDPRGKGILYTGGIIDSGVKIMKTEGVGGLYKGVIPLFFKSAPHIILLMFFWEKYKALFSKFSQ